MRAFWLTWMWLARGMMAWCVAWGIYCATSGRTANAVVTLLIGLPLNAFTAEFSRRGIGE